MTILIRDPEVPDAALELTRTDSSLRVVVSMGYRTGHLTQVDFVLPERDALTAFMQALLQLADNQDEVGALLAQALDRLK